MMSTVRFTGHAREQARDLYLKQARRSFDMS